MVLLSISLIVEKNIKSNFRNTILQNARKCIFNFQKYEVHENTHLRLNAKIFTSFSFSHERGVGVFFAILYFTVWKSTARNFW